MRFFTPSVILSIFLASEAVTALPAESPHDALARLERKAATCNTNDCLQMMTNRASAASADCTSLLSSTPGTVTVTKWASSTTTPSALTTTPLIGTKAKVATVTSTYTSDQTILAKRTVDPATAAISALVPLSCISSAGALVTARASRACSCLLSTSATITVTSTPISTLPASTVTQTTSYASTTTSTLGAVATSVSTITVSTTSSSSSAAPTQTSKVILNSGANAGKTLWVNYEDLLWDYSSSGSNTTMSFITAGGQPFLPDQPDMRLYVAYDNYLYFQTASDAGSNPSVSCSVDATGVLSCLSSNGLETIFTCGGYVFIGAFNFSQSGCKITTLRLSS